MIWAKKRFEVFKRDSFRCTYCWKTWKDVTLEIDHITPKSKWWKDTIDNLTTCCRECNIGKWSIEINKQDPRMYKTKTNDLVYKMQNHLYSERNRNVMWTICKKTITLLKMYFNEYVDHEIEDYVGYESRESDTDMYIKFRNWSEYCDKVLHAVEQSTILATNDIIEDVFNDKEWTSNDDNNKDRFNWRLNYEFTEWFRDHLDEKKHYVIRKFTLFNNLLDND